MNLTKLFNFNYLKQNLKKSKGLILLLTFIVPVLNILMFISYNTSSYLNSIDFYTAAVINIVGMFIIPLLLSILLYGYVYKRNSVDFINSMPISRTCLYITNFVAGIGIIFIIQALVAIVNIASAAFLENIYIPFAMILDLFIFMLVSYIFMFSVTSLAMAVSGNIQTQIVVTLLVLFLIPFSSLAFSEFNIYENLEVHIGEKIKVIDTTNLPNYTTPFMLISGALGSGQGFFDISSILKTIVVTIIYLILGIFLFNRRKMEYVQSSFSKPWVHLIVKGLTLVPMIFLLVATEPDEVGTGIAVVLFFIYYLVYDFITHKKIKFRYTVLCFIVTSLLLTGVYKGATYLNSQVIKEIDLEDIAKVAVEIDLIGANDLTTNEEFDVYIEDKQLIKDLFMNIKSTRIQSYEMSEYYTVDYAYVDDYDGSEECVYKNIKIKLKNGKEIYSDVTINYEFYETIVKDLLTNEKTKKQYREMLNLKDSYILYDGQMLDKETTIKIEKILNSLELSELIQENTDDYITPYKYEILTRGSSNPYMRLYYYKNHELRNISIDKCINKEMFDIITTALNKKTMENLSNPEVQLDTIHINVVDLEISDVSMNINLGKAESEIKFIEYFKKHYADKCNMNEPYYTFEIYGGNIERGAYIFLNATDELTQMILENGNDSSPLYTNEIDYVY